MSCGILNINLIRRMEYCSDKTDSQRQMIKLYYTTVFSKYFHFTILRSLQTTSPWTEEQTLLAASCPLCLATQPEEHFSLGSSLNAAVSPEARRFLECVRRLMAEPELLPPIWIETDKTTGIPQHQETRLNF